MAEPHEARRGSRREGAQPDEAEEEELMEPRVESLEQTRKDWHLER